MNLESFDKYQIGEKKESELFKKALVFFDTSALLDFYYYSNETTTEIFNKIFKALQGRLYITYQTEFEFLKNRKTVLQKPLDSYDNLLKVNKIHKDSGHVNRIEEIIKTSKEQLAKDLFGQFKTLKEKTAKSDKHPFLNDKIFVEFENELEQLNNYIDGFESSFNSFKNEVEREVDNKKQSLDKKLKKDDVLKHFQKFFTTTRELKHKEIIEIIKDGEIRYRNQIPPGYLDEDEKIGFQKYGDLIVWKQLLEQAKIDGRDVILIINDLKEDWWHFEKKEQPTAPRYELIKEFNDLTNCQFWMYTTNDFLYKSKLHIDKDIEDKTIKDVENIVRQWPDEEQIIVVDWAFAYFEEVSSIEFNGRPSDSGIDYTIHCKQGRYGVQHQSTQRGRYTGMFLPLRNIYSKKDEIKSKYNLDKIVYILESTSEIIARQLTHHLSKRNPQKLLQEMNNDFQLIMAYRDNENIVVLFDSNKDVKVEKT
jgi:hypothetical protein